MSASAPSTKWKLYPTYKPSGVEWLGARLTFDLVVNDRLQDMVETNFKFYKRVTDDREFAKFFLDWLFERFRSKVTGREA